MLQINEWILRVEGVCTQNSSDMLNILKLFGHVFFQRIEEKVRPGFYAATEV